MASFETLGFGLGVSEDLHQRPSDSHVESVKVRDRRFRFRGVHRIDGLQRLETVGAHARGGAEHRALKETSKRVGNLCDLQYSIALGHGSTTSASPRGRALQAGARESGIVRGKIGNASRAHGPVALATDAGGFLPTSIPEWSKTDSPSRPGPWSQRLTSQSPRHIRSGITMSVRASRCVSSSAGEAPIT